MISSPFLEDLGYETSEGKDCATTLYCASLSESGIEKLRDVWLAGGDDGNGAKSCGCGCGCGDGRSEKLCGMAG